MAPSQGKQESVAELIAFDDAENKKHLPHKSVDIVATVIDFACTVMILQEYVNPFPMPLEAVYMFPVEAGAAVIFFEAVIGKRKIKGYAKEAKQARQEYEVAVSKGKKAIYMEEIRRDVLQMRIGQIQPGETARICLK